MAHLERPLYVQVLVSDALGNLFDNFTSLRLEWTVENQRLLDYDQHHHGQRKTDEAWPTGARRGGCRVHGGPGDGRRHLHHHHRR